MKLKSKMTLFIFGVIILPFILFISFSNRFFTQDYINQIDASNKTITKNVSMISNAVALYVTQFIDNAYAVTKEIALDPKTVSFSAASQERLLKEKIKNYPYVDLFYIQGLDGMQTARSSGSCGDRSNRWWFIKFMKDQKPYVTKSYYSISNNLAVSSIIYPINNNGRLIGIMGTDLKLDYLQELVGKFNEDDWVNEIYIFDGEGVVIAHPDYLKVQEKHNYKKLVKNVLKRNADGQPLLDKNGNQVEEELPIKVPDGFRDIINKAQNGENGVTEYMDLNGEKIIAAYNTIRIPGFSDNWVVVTEQKKVNVLERVGFIKKFNIIGTMIIFAFILISIFILARKIINGIMKTKNKVEKLAHGNLTENIEVGGSAEIKELGDSANQSIKNLANLIRRVKENVKIVFNASKELEKSANQSSEDSLLVKEYINKIIDKSSLQAERINNANKLSEEMNEQIVEINNSLQEMSAFVEEVNSLSQKGNGKLRETVAQIREIRATTDKISELMDRLNKDSAQIGQIIHLIAEIAEGIDLLSINASIEAARAGKAGKGFAVVASQIKKLSQGANVATQQIVALIQNTQANVNEAFTAMQEGNVKVAQGEAIALDTSESFVQIVESISQAGEKINNISDLSDHMVRANTKLEEAFNAFTHISGELLQATQEIVQISNNQIDSMDKVVEVADKLGGVSISLKENSEKFVTE